MSVINNLLKPLLCIVFLAAGLVTQAEAQLIDVTEQSVAHIKNLTISFWSTGVPQAGENATFLAPPLATSFSNTWTDTASFSGVTVNGNSSLDYGFSNNIFTFSSATDTSRSGTSIEDITAVARGSGFMSVTITLNEATTVLVDIFMLADNNGTGGSGGSPFAFGGFQKQTGIDPRFGPIFEPVFPNQSVFDTTVANGSDELTLSDSALLEPGTYRIIGQAAVQNLYHQRLTAVASSAQFASVDLRVEFLTPDDDGDGVNNALDLCPETAPTAAVDPAGCSDAQVDGDGDGVCDPGAVSIGPSACGGSDNCPVDPNPDQANQDGDALGDACDADDDNDGDSDTDEIACGSDPLDAAETCANVDTDNDQVADVVDVCPATVIPDGVPTSKRGLGRNRWTLDNPDGSFTQGPPQAGRTMSFSTTDTGGCSCEQIIAELGLGKGHSKYGCSNSAMMDWANMQ